MLNTMRLKFRWIPSILKGCFYLNVEAFAMMYFFSSSLRSSSKSLPSSLASQSTIMEGSSTAGWSSSGRETSRPLGILTAVDWFKCRLMTRAFWSAPQWKCYHQPPDSPHPPPHLPGFLRLPLRHCTSGMAPPAPPGYPTADLSR